MKKIFLILLIFIANIVSAQEDIETIRQKAYEAKEADNLEKSAELYSKILKINPDDYDATLATARLFFKLEKYNKSIALFNKILSNDKTDVEALKGLGDNFLYTDRTQKAIEFYKKAISYQPDYIPLYFDLAKAYSWADMLDKAIKTYRQILKKDNTYSEAFQGIGKMYYWMEKPYKSLSYYKKAVELDPEEKSIINEYENVKKQTLFNVKYSPKYIKEDEENYVINAFVQQLGIQKRLTDRFYVSANFLLDFSNRNFTGTEIGDTLRLYNNAWLKAGYIAKNHKVYLYGGYSASDEKFSTYGINWKSNYNIKSIKISNNITAGYDYFYYWNNVGQNKVDENLKLEYKKYFINLGYTYGIVDKAFILDVPNDKYYEDYNPYSSYGASLGYQIGKKYKIKVAANYSYTNYTYKSNRYYSPLGKNIYGPSLSVYYPIGKFYFYSDMKYDWGSEFYYENIDSVIEKNYLNAEAWAVNTEVGYDYKRFSTSVNFSRFYNNFYNNILVALNLNYKF